MKIGSLGFLAVISLAACGSASDRDEDAALSVGQESVSDLCDSDLAITRLKEAIQDVTDPDLISYEVTDEVTYFEIVGTLIGPDPGFSPRAKAHKKSCRVFEIAWR